MWKLLAVLSLAALVMPGCFDHNDKSAKDFIQEVKQEKQEKIPPLQEVQEYKSTEYHASNVRDPFQLLQDYPIAEPLQLEGLDTGIQQPKPDAHRKREALENYSLDSLSMVGVIKKGTTFWGIVKDKTGIIYRVHIGNYLGENSGYIEKITEQSIYIKEIIADGQGGWAERKVSLSLTK